MLMLSVLLLGGCSWVELAWNALTYPTTRFGESANVVVNGEWAYVTKGAAGIQVVHLQRPPFARSLAPSHAVLGRSPGLDHHLGENLGKHASLRPAPDLTAAGLGDADVVGMGRRELQALRSAAAIMKNEPQRHRSP
jgi:hypothetical protein